MLSKMATWRPPDVNEQLKDKGDETVRIVLHCEPICLLVSDQRPPLTRYRSWAAAASKISTDTPAMMPRSSLVHHGRHQILISTLGCSARSSCTAYLLYNSSTYFHPDSVNMSTQNNDPKISRTETDSGRTNIETDTEINVAGKEPSAVAALPPEEGIKGWLCVFGSFLTLFCTFGFLNAYVDSQD